MKKRKIGVCGVDSGQILICDPCYIISEWIKEDKDPEAKRIFRCTFHGKPFDLDMGELMKKGKYFKTPLAELEGLTPNEALINGLLKPIPTPSKRTHEFSYDGCCEETLSKELAGQLNYKLGHAGAGVVASSGYGDGEYPVYAYYNKEGRIVKLEIIFTGTYTEKVYRKMTGADKK